MLILILLKGAITDWKTRIVPNSIWITSSVLSLIIAILRGYSIKQILLYSSWLFLLLLFLGIINYAITRTDGVGGADLKIAPAVTLFYGPIGSYVVLLIVILSLIGQSVFKQTDESYIPLVTYYFIGCVISFIFFLL